MERYVSRASAQRVRFQEVSCAMLRACEKERRGKEKKKEKKKKRWGVNARGCASTTQAGKQHQDITHDAHSITHDANSITTHDANSITTHDANSTTTHDDTPRRRTGCAPRGPPPAP